MPDQSYPPRFSKVQLEWIGQTSSSMPPVHVGEEEDPGRFLQSSSRRLGWSHLPQRNVRYLRLVRKTRTTGLKCMLNLLVLAANPQCLIKWRGPFKSSLSLWSFRVLSTPSTLPVDPYAAQISHKELATIPLLLVAVIQALGADGR